MYNTMMENNSVDDNRVTFIELQTIKKDDLFEPESPIPVVLPPYTDKDDQTLATVALLQIAEHVTHDVCEESFSLGANNGDDVVGELETPNAETEENLGKVTIELKAAKLKSKKKSKYRGWNVATNNKKLRAKIMKKKSKIFPKSTKPAKAPSETAPKKPKCEYPRLCTGCGHAYKTKQSFWNHKQRCTMLPQNMMRNMGVDENGLPIEGEGGAGEFVRRKEYICAHCERHYRKKYNLQEHLKNTCRGKPCSKGRLQCWEEGCMQAFYKYVDLVQHVTLQHGKDLQIQKLQFANFNAFNSWKTEESNSKFMYARKITGSKRFSNTKYHYFVCQFNHRNEKKNNNRKTNRRKSVNLVVPNYNCPSRIMVKECDNLIQVTYISSHNHELNLANVKYQPLEKETRTYIKNLLQLGVNAKKIIQHLQEGVGNPEIDSFLSTKQQFLTLNRIKRMESKLKAKNRARQLELAKQEEQLDLANDCVPHDNSFSPPCQDVAIDPGFGGSSSSCAQLSTPTPPAKKDSNEVIRSIETNLKKLKVYMHKSNVKEQLTDRISKMIQELCDECEHVENTGEKPPQRKPRSQTTRKRKTAPVPPPLPPQPPLSLQPQPQQPQLQPQPQIQQSILVQQQQPIQSHIIFQQPITIIDQNRIVANVTTSIIQNEKTFTPAIYENVELVKPMYQPFNVNLLCLKSIDPYIPEREQLLLARVDEQFSLGYLYDAVIDSFMDLVCQSMTNVVTVSTGITEYVQMNQKVPDMWQCYNWHDVDTLFIPCNPSKKQWFLLVLLVKSSELQIVDPLGSFDTMPNIMYKKYESSIQCWYNVLHTFLGISHCNVTFPPHTRHNDPANSGVLICWYVFQYINKRNLVDNIDTDIFRKYIYDTIINNIAHC